MYIFFKGGRGGGAVYGTVKAVVFIRNKRPGRSVKENVQRVHKSGPLLFASASFENDWPLHVSRSLEMGNALDSLGMREGGKKEKLAETQGISGGSEAGCSISPSFKNYCQALHRLGPMCLARNNGSLLELMKQLSANSAINQLSKFHSAWVADWISVWVEYTRVPWWNNSHCNSLGGSLVPLGHRDAPPPLQSCFPFRSNY